MSLHRARISHRVRHYFHTMLAYCPCLISHSTAIYHFRRVPKVLPNKRFESGGGIFNGNTGIFRRHSGCLLLPLLLLLFFFSFSFFRFWQARRSKGTLLPPQVTNRSLDSSQISRDRFLTQQEISLSLISRDLVARDLVTPLAIHVYKCHWRGWQSSNCRLKLKATKRAASFDQLVLRTCQSVISGE